MMTNFDPEPRSFESADGHVRINVDLASEREPVWAVTLGFSIE